MAETDSAQSSSQFPKIYDGGTAGKRGYTEMEFDGVVYAIEAILDADGRTTLTFLSSPPPQGLDRVRYQWHGRLTHAR